jgi:hypothetical protein
MGVQGAFQNSIVGIIGENRQFSAGLQDGGRAADAF